MKPDIFIFVNKKRTSMRCAETSLGMDTVSHRQRRRGGCFEEQRHDSRPEGRPLWGVSRKKKNKTNVDEGGCH